MALSDCELTYEASAVLQGREDMSRSLTLGGPINEGTLVGMIKEVMNMPAAQARECSIAVDGSAAGGKTWLEYEEIKQIFGRSDFPK